MVQTNLDRTKFPPQGVQGGRQAKPGRFTLIDGQTGEQRSIDKEKGLALKPGDIVCVETGGGGGYGPPSRRALAAIQRDLDAGYVSRAGVERDYAVAVGADGRARRRSEFRMKRFARELMSILVASIAGVLAAGPAGAETVAEFYRGKTITMYVGTGVGAGAVSAYPTALAPVMKKYLPGHPDLIVSYMPGGGGIKAANYIYGIAPQDGTAWGFITRGFLLAPLLKVPQAQFDPTKFNWIGSPSRTVSIGMVWNASTDVRTVYDAMNKQVVVGATSIAQDTGIFPRALNRIAGTRFKIVPGYAGLGAVDLAIERGEVQGKVGSTWKSLNSGPTANWVRDHKVTVLVQLGVKKAVRHSRRCPARPRPGKNAERSQSAGSAVRPERHRLPVLHGARTFPRTAWKRCAAPIYKA